MYVPNVTNLIFNKLLKFIKLFLFFFILQIKYFKKWVYENKTYEYLILVGVVFIILEKCLLNYKH